MVRSDASRPGRLLPLAAAAGVSLAGAALAEGPGGSAPHRLLGTVLGYFTRQPFVLLFLLVAAGYALGRLKVKGIALGATAATMLLSLGVSLAASAGFGIHYALPEFASTLFFNLFMFAVGMKVGPQFLSGLRRDAARFIALGLLVPALATGLALLVKAVTHPPPGLLAGLLAGAVTASPGLGAAQAALASSTQRLPEGVSLTQAQGNLSTAFAFAYCVGLIAFVVMLKLLPRLFGRDPEADARAFEAAARSAGGVPLPGSAEAFLRGDPIDAVRVYRLEQPALEGKTIAELQRLHPYVSVERLQRDGQLLEPEGELALRRGDELALHGRLSRLVAGAGAVGPEVDAPGLREVGLETAEVVVERPAAVGKTLSALAAEQGHGLVLNALFRGGESIPFGASTPLRRGDVLRVTGSRERLAHLEQGIGAAVRASLSTDIITLALGLALGALVGTIPVRLGQLHLSLSSAVGLLLVGITLSTLRTRNPALGGPFPEPARQLLEDLGLNVFIAITGLNAGAGVVQVIRSGEVGTILLGAVLVGLLPALVAWVVGQYLFKMNSALLMGAVAGARCNSPGLRASQEVTHSAVPAVSYPVTFALSNVALTLISYLLALA